MLAGNGIFGFKGEKRVTVDNQMAYPELTDEQIDCLRPYGQCREVDTGTVLFHEGDDDYDFIVILKGSIDILDHSTGEERVIVTHTARRFLGEINMLTGQRVFLTARAHEPSDILAIPPEQLREIIAELPELSEIILNAFLVRRAILQDVVASGMLIIGSRYSRDSLRLHEFAARNRLPFTWVDLENDRDAETMLSHFNVRPDQTPVVILQGRDVFRNPTNADLAECLGLHEDIDPNTVADLIVIGGGPAGLAASVYGASEGLDTVVIDSTALGGQAATSSKIENYLGFPAGLSGADLADRAMVQARKFGARISVPHQATALRCEGDVFSVDLGDGTTINGRSVIIATGAAYRRLPVDDLERFEGVGVYYAATEVEAQLCSEDEVVVVGGGNSAGQATVFLSERTKHVYIVIRGDDLGKSMSRYLVNRIERTPNITLLCTTEIAELQGEEGLQGVVVVNKETGEQQTLPCNGLFSFIGADPCTDWLKDTVALDAKGFVLTGPAAKKARGGQRWPRSDRDPFLLETTLPGVFATGDVRSSSTKRVASAVGEGSIAVQMVHQYLAEHGRFA